MQSAFHVFRSNGDDFVVNPCNMRFAKVGAGIAEALRAGRTPVEDIESLIGAPRDPFNGKEPEWKFSPPQKIVLMLTYACNMACRYCCQGEIPDMRDTEMPEEVARQAVDWLIEHSGGAPEIGVGWFGGEPLMKFGMIRKITAYAEEKAAASGKKVRFGTMTNGLGLTDEVIEFIASRPYEMTVSFDGPRELQDANRPLKNGAASYDIIAPRLKALTRRYPYAEMRATLFPGTDIEAVFATARGLGFRKCRIEKVSSSLTPGGMKNDEAKSTDEFLAHMERQAGHLIGAARARDAARLEQLAIDRVLLEAVRQASEASHPFLPGHRRCFSCGTGRQFLTAAVNGDIYPCPRFLARPEHRIGSIYERELRNEVHRKSLLFHADQCPSCWIRFYCGGACIVEHMGATGSIFKVNPDTCRWRKGKFEQAIRAIASLDEDDLRFLGAHRIIRG